MNKKRIYALLFCIASLSINSIKGMQCIKKSRLNLQNISMQKPLHSRMIETSNSQLNHLQLTFESPYFYVAGTRVDSCKMRYEIALNPAQHTMIRINALSKKNNFLYIKAQQKAANPQWFEVKVQNITIPKEKRELK